MNYPSWLPEGVPWIIVQEEQRWFRRNPKWRAAVARGQARVWTDYIFDSGEDALSFVEKHFKVREDTA